MSAPEIEIDLFSPTADPYPVFDALRDNSPVHWSPRYRSWFVTRFDDVSAALRDPRFSADRITPYVEAKLSGPDTDPALRQTFAVLEDWMVFKDPPDHTRLRRLLRRAFTPRTIEALRPRVGELADELLDGIAGNGSADLIGEYAYPLTAAVIAEMLGVPREDRDLFKDWSDAITALVFAGLGSPERHERAVRGMLELRDYLTDLAAQVTAHPRDDLLTALVQARDEGDALSHDEVVSTGVLLLFAGHETTTNLIGNGLLALLRHPDQRALLEAGEVRIVSAIEEFLRYDGPAKTVVRLMATDVELRGHTLKAGSRVFLCPPSANRDPAVFPDPGRLDLTRTENQHVGFGFGLHYCLGAPLARLEGGIAIPRALQRLTDLRLAPDAELTWQPVLLSRGLTALPVQFGATSEGDR
ncbi:MAG: Peroxidase [Modestobacter sp.]|jgi:cytochrome P450|nr:Peroxidase [Modestobacter sp.]HEV7872300.1 cytochrome P450 [Modestobacter sp.]